MILKSIPVGAYQENCYFLIDESTKDCVIFDPGAQEDLIFAVIERLDIKPKIILLTHGHHDHVGAVKAVKEKFNIPLYMNEKDEKMIKISDGLFGEVPKVDFYLHDGQIIKFAGEDIKVIETPGHTPGGTCFYVDEKLITGDTLFNSSIGRTDFMGGDFKTLIASIKDKLLILNDDTKAYPGHGDSTTIAYEKRHNPFLLGEDYVY